MTMMNETMTKEPKVECFYCMVVMTPHHNRQENEKTLRCPTCRHEVILHV